jgi:hypothetical protein
VTDSTAIEPHTCIDLIVAASHLRFLPSARDRRGAPEAATAGGRPGRGTGGFSIVKGWAHGSHSTGHIAAEYPAVSQSHTA